MKIFVTTILAAVLALSSCTTKCSYNPGLWVRFNGFDTSDLGTIITTQYNKGTNNATLKKVYINDTSRIKGTFGDTVYNYFNYFYDFPYQLEILSDYDYTIYLPKVGKTVKITDISYDQLSGSPACCWECSNSVNYTIDGVQKHIQGYPPQQHGLYDTDVSITINK